jgi:putative heme-binding domain-containing protein
MEGSEARKAVRSALSDSDPTVQQAAAHSCGLYRDLDAVSSLQGILRTASTHVRRQAATALGQIGEKQSVRFLLEAAQGEIDRALEHSLIYALIQINEPEKTRAALGSTGSKDPSVQRVALIALDQMENGHLTANEVVPLLGGTPSPVQQAANWVVSHHAEWAGDLIAHIKNRLESGHSDADLQAQIVRFVKEAKMQQLIAGELVQNRSPEVKTTLLDAISESNLKTAPAAWGEAVASALQDPNSTVAHAGIRAAKAITSTNKIDPAIEKIVREAASDSKKGDDLRLELMSLLPARSAIDPPLFHYAVGHLTASTPVMQRINAASVVGRASLTEEQLTELSGQLPEVGPLEITRLLPAFDGHPSEEVGLKLIAGLKQSKGTAAVPPEMLRSRFAKYPEKVQQAATDLLKSFDITLADKKKRLDEFEASLPSGDIHRGHLIFNGTKAACATCHAVGYLGGQVGPDLTRIGAIRTQRDLLEAILYPSASFARGFEPMVILTKDGEEHSGLVRKEASDSLLLVSGPAAEQRILRSDIREMRPSTVSVMPEGLEQQLSKQEMSDLVAFLRALK